MIGSQVRRRAHVTAHADDNICLLLLQQTAHLADAGGELERKGENLWAQSPWEGHLRDCLQAVARLRNQSLLQSFVCPQHENVRVRVLEPQVFGNRQHRSYVPRCAAAGKENVDQIQLLLLRNDSEPQNRDRRSRRASATPSSERAKDSRRPAAMSAASIDDPP